MCILVTCVALRKQRDIFWQQKPEFSSNSRLSKWLIKSGCLSSCLNLRTTFFKQQSDVKYHMVTHCEKKKVFFKKKETKKRVACDVI